MAVHTAKYRSVEYNKFVSTTVNIYIYIDISKHKTINTIKIKPLTPTTSLMPEM
jgi:hypothetical protein